MPSEWSVGTSSTWPSASPLVASRLLLASGYALFAAGIVTAEPSGHVAMSLPRLSRVGHGSGDLLPAVTVRIAELLPGVPDSTGIRRRDVGGTILQG